MPDAIRRNKLTRSAIEAAALALSCEPAAVRAVAEVEARGDGFLPDGRPKILFEAAQFSRRTNGMFDLTHPTISAPTWSAARKLYKGGAAEYLRLAAAVELAEKPALESTSWGTFQIMGFNARACGFPGVRAFMAAMHESADKHLAAFVRLIMAWGLDDAMRARDWSAFALRYNGSGQVAYYARKLAEAYARHDAAVVASPKR